MMTKKLSMSTILLAALLPFGANAAEAVATFDIDKMTCAGCRYIVKQSMNSVEGVQDVEVSYKQRQAVVTYDDALTDPQTIAAASTANGYPATVMRGDQ